METFWMRKISSATMTSMEDVKHLAIVARSERLQLNQKNIPKKG